MAYTQADLDNVEAAIIDLATSKLAVKFVIDGDVVEYARVALPELKKFRNEIAAELSAADPNTETISAFVVHGGKGL